MKVPRQSFNQLPAWQLERVKKLQRAGERIRKAVASGKPVQKTIRRVARSLNGRPYRCDASRQLRCSPQTMRRVWDNWRRGGEVPAAFALHFNSRRIFIPPVVMIRFAEFCAANRQRSLASAWRTFSARAGSFGRGRHTGRRLKISPDRIYQYFPVAIFYQIQGELKAIYAAQTNLGKFKLKAIATINARLAVQTASSHRVKPGISFEI